jgi:hypothetical protein
MVDVKQSIAVSIPGDVQPDRRTSGRAGARVKVWLRSAWRATGWSSATPRLAARAEAKDLGRSLSRIGLPHRDISRTLPALARSIAEYDRRRRRIWLGLGQPLVFLFCLPGFLVGVGHRVLFPANLFLPKLDADGELLALGIYFVTFMVLILLGGELRRRSTEYRRQIKYGPSSIRLVDRLSRISRWLYPPFLFVMVTLINFGLPPTIWTDGHTIWLATATAGAAVLWFGMFGFALFRIQASGTLFGSRSSDLGVVRALADAYTAVIAGGTSDFRSFARRAEISAHLRVAAGLLEGPMLRVLSGGDRAAEMIVRPHLEAAAAGVREKLAWLATPKSDTREYLARALGEALIAATAGDLARLTSSEPVVTAAAGDTWQSRLIGFGHWSLVALGPAAALWLGWSLIPDPATRGLTVQIAATFFVVATFSRLYPGARDELSSVVSTGATLFGWGKPKG